MNSDLENAIQEAVSAKDVVARSEGKRAGPRVIAPGRNCWRVEEAGRAAVLVDGAPYFAALEETMRRARRSILILGWDFDGRTLLRPDTPLAERVALGDMLRRLVEKNPALEVRILVWSV